MPLFALENVVRLQPRERYTLHAVCWLSLGIGAVWAIYILYVLVIRRLPFESATGILLCWLVVFGALAGTSLWLSREASKPIRRVAERFRWLLIIVFSARVLEGLIHSRQGGLLFVIYLFLALLALWTVCNQAGLDQTGFLRLAVTGAVFAFVAVFFVVIGVGNGISGTQTWQSVFWTVSPQIALTPPHLLYLWGAHRYKHLLLTAQAGDDGLDP